MGRDHSGDLDAELLHQIAVSIMDADDPGDARVDQLEGRLGLDRSESPRVIRRISLKGVCELIARRASGRSPS